MAWTYTDSPATVPRDAVRVLIGDTDSTWPQPVSDNEIAYFLSARNSVVELAAADCAEKIAAYYSRQADTTNGKQQVSASQRSLQYRALAAELKVRAVQVNAPTGVWAGGQSIAEKQGYANNTDAVQPPFAMGMDDEAGANNSEPLQYGGS